MGIRIQPREIEVPEKDPFENDLLDRKESVEVLTHLVRSFEGPCVLAVDAAWETARPRSSEFGLSTCATWDFPLSSSMPGRPTSPRSLRCSLHGTDGGPPRVQGQGSIAGQEDRQDEGGSDGASSSIRSRFDSTSEPRAFQ